MMMDVHRRLQRGATAIAVVDALRGEVEMPRLGQKLVDAVVDTELRDLALLEEIAGVDRRIAEICGRGQVS
jgi:hypothetical protein